MMQHTPLDLTNFTQKFEFIGVTRAEVVTVYCEPRIPLKREKFLIHEILQTGKFISDFIFPAIEEELKDTKIP
ncbi:hypothetical protein TSMEX_008761 [Taenia solium]|eukprot:TsM_000842500 transcript=TsM_000842500 gene=TsM_000842500